MPSSLKTVGLGLLEVGVVEHEEPVGTRLGQGPEHRMALADEEAAAWAEQGRDDLRPAADIRQPAERADPRVDEIEAACSEDGGRVVDLRRHEARLGAGLFGQQPCLLDRRLREVETGDAGAEARQGDGVGADVALEVNGLEAPNVAEPRQVEADDLAQEPRFLGETRDRVLRRGRMRRHALVPVGAVDLAVVGHGCSFADAGR